MYKIYALIVAISRIKKRTLSGHNIETGLRNIVWPFDKKKTSSPSFVEYSIICVLIYIQRDVMLHSLLYRETALHVAGGTTTHHQEHKQLYLQHLVFVTPLLLSAAIVEELELV